MAVKEGSEAAAVARIVQIFLPAEVSLAAGVAARRAGLWPHSKASAAAAVAQQALIRAAKVSLSLSGNVRLNLKDTIT